MLESSSALNQCGSETLICPGLIMAALNIACRYLAKNTGSEGMVAFNLVNLVLLLAVYFSLLCTVL